MLFISPFDALHAFLLSVIKGRKKSLSTTYGTDLELEKLTKCQQIDVNFQLAWHNI